MTTTAYAGNGDREGVKSVMDWAISRQAPGRPEEAPTTSEYWQCMFVENSLFLAFQQTFAKPMSHHECPTTDKAEYQRQYRLRNRERLKKQKAEWYAKNREAQRQKRREDYAKNSDAYKARNKMRYAEKRDEVLATNRKWVENNWEVRAAVYGRARARRLTCDNVVPAWYNHAEAIKVYAEAKRLTDETGVQHHVDHILPLAADHVSGLHWHGNLQVLTAGENCRKRNSVDDIVWTASKDAETVDKEPQ